jgi:pyruvate dehydrogenase E2 component (dihydrolipoamide acetyltransferase)
MKEVLVPDLGDVKEAGVIEVLVKPGDTVTAEQSLITLETEKATMEIPSPGEGVVKEIRIKVGDMVSTGTVILMLEGASAPAAAAKAEPAAATAKAAAAASSTPKAAEAPSKAAASASAASSSGSIRQVLVPDLGDVKEAGVIEVLVKPGDAVTAEQSLITLETEKATMELPSPSAGVVKELHIKVGDMVSTGKLILSLEEQAPAVKEPPKKEVPKQEPGKPAPAQQPPKAPASESPAAPAAAVAFSANANEEVETPHRRPPPLAAEQPVDGARAHAGPSVRKFARELGVDLAQVRGSGPKGRVLAADVQAWVKNLVARGPAQSGSGIGLDLLPWPVVDFAKFGPIEVEPLSRIKKISGANLARNWVMIPHVTNNDVADITELESFRVQLNKENDAPGVKVTMLAFLIKACVAALKTHPQFNASLDGDNLVYKHYYNIGFAADTANGLVVPVIKDADKKGILEVAKESADLARQAREGKLKSTDMQGGTFSISSLGGIGGTTFTPIINAPEVAILGVSKSVIQPVWDGKAFQPRLQLPLSLSYDHRVIDGATAARFNAHLAQLLADFRRAML